MSDDNFDEFNKFIERRGGGWDDYIKRALEHHPRGLAKAGVVHLIRADARVRGRELPATFNDVIQAAFNRNNADSALFKGRREEALFCLADGQRGVWKLNRYAIAR